MDAQGWTARELARVLNVHESLVSRAMVLLDLPAPVQDDVAAGRISPSAAREVAKVCGVDNQRALAARVKSEGLNRAQTVDAVRGRNATPPAATRRVFPTSVGLVIVELHEGAPGSAIYTAFIEASRSLKRDHDAARIREPAPG